MDASALAAMEERKFRVVLSKIKLADGSRRRLIPATQMASGWLFLLFPWSTRGRASFRVPRLPLDRSNRRAIHLFSFRLIKNVRVIPKENVSRSLGNAEPLSLRLASFHLCPICPNFESGSYLCTPQVASFIHSAEIVSFAFIGSNCVAGGRRFSTVFHRSPDLYLVRVVRLLPVPLVIVPILRPQDQRPDGHGF